jgi:hypothetical protein
MYLSSIRQHRSIAEITQRISEKVRQQVPGVIPLLQPYPTLNIDTGATSKTQARAPLPIS